MILGETDTYGSGGGFALMILLFLIPTVSLGLFCLIRWCLIDVGEKLRLSIYSVMAIILLVFDCLVALTTQKGDLDLIIVIAMWILFWVGNISLIIIACRFLVIVADILGGNAGKNIVVSALLILFFVVPFLIDRSALEGHWLGHWLMHAVRQWLSFPWY